ncbi:MAG: phosphate propanoyltransferase [Candidatus Omnitrophota bacterium]|nr:phosphate propanoyltransferase [Candidatus Omnitrophota bacterium]MBU2529394.1 phosphate propanoyltransferase [bacterium]MBU3929960.1 phosphate propanoyltransferase [bacterium]MBU4122684.1 phosphate propanoyltransferase [bacterium]
MIEAKTIAESIARKLRRASKPVICNVSNRHVHITQENFSALFGQTYAMRKLKDLMQPGEFASKELIEIAGPRGSIKKVRILGPFRKYTQVEISRTDSFKLGVSAPVKESGKISGSSPLRLVGPAGEIELKEGCLVAVRHIHMTPADAKELELKDGETVRIEINGKRGGIMGDTLVRVSPNYALECHIDTDEANAFDFKSGGWVYVV